MATSPADDNDTPNKLGLARLNEKGLSTEETIQIIQSPLHTRQLYLSLIRLAQKEVLLIFPTTNAIRREESTGIFGELRKAAKRGIAVSILAAEDEFVKSQLDSLRSEGITVRSIESPSVYKFKLLIVDKTFSLVIETKNDAMQKFEQAVGLATYSNSKATVLPLVTIFESFWRETDLYERARQSDRIKDEFVNTAAHELRNPILPLLASGEFALENGRKIQEGLADEKTISELMENLRIIVRNSSKVYKLSEDILQVSKIESGAFSLNMTEVDLQVLLNVSIQDARKKLTIDRKDGVQVEPEFALPVRTKGVFYVYCDSSKISQVLGNLLDNAIKFTDRGRITVGVKMQSDSDVTIRVQDSGRGIHPDIRNKLFEKFASRADGGTGLGLYLCKKIIEAHGGRIWARENNEPNGGGAIFEFTLPLEAYGRSGLLTPQQKHTLDSMQERNTHDRRTNFETDQNLNQDLAKATSQVGRSIGV